MWAITFSVTRTRFSNLAPFELKTLYGKSCYDMLLSLNGLPYTGFSEAWKRFWKLPLPPKVLDFVWRLCSNCLPLRVRLHQKGVVLDRCCGLCDIKVEDASHLFLNCSFA